PRPRLAVRLRRSGQRRRAVHLLPAAQDRPWPRADDPHAARRRIHDQAGEQLSPGGPVWRRRPQRLSLRARLLWTFLVPLAVVLVLVGVVSTAALRHELIGQVDSQLTSALTRSSSAVGGYDHDDDEGPPPSSGDGDPLGARGQGAGTLVARAHSDGEA